MITGPKHFEGTAIQGTSRLEVPDQELMVRFSRRKLALGSIHVSKEVSVRSEETLTEFGKIS